jgi:hypothetical protein
MLLRGNVRKAGELQAKRMGRQERTSGVKPMDAKAEAATHPPWDVHNRIKFPVTMAGGPHLFPSRTQKLSLQTLMVLGWKRPGRVGSRRIQFRRRRKRKRIFLLQPHSSVAQWQSIRLLTEGLLVRAQPGEPTVCTNFLRLVHAFLLPALV